jgi:ATP-dependent DNA ligase
LAPAGDKQNLDCFPFETVRKTFVDGVAGRKRTTFCRPLAAIGTKRFKKIAHDAFLISASSAIIDGQAAAPSADGIADFSVLQNQLKGKSDKIVLVAFDQLYATLQARALAFHGLKRFAEALADNQRSHPTDVATNNNIGDALQSLSRKVSRHATADCCE